jgi:ABC-type ATPase involved in cell division
MIRFDKVSKVYSGGHQALQKVSFHLRKGEMAFLTGHSGAGKSTLLKLISVMERPPMAGCSFMATMSAISSAARSPMCVARSG